MSRKYIDIHRLQSDIVLEHMPAQPSHTEHNLNSRKIITNDVYEQACNITAWQQLYDQLHPGTFKGSLSEVWIDGLQFFKESTNLALRQSCVVWPGAVWFGIPKKKSQDSFVCASKVEDTNIATFVGGQEFELLTPDNLELMGFVVSESELEHLFELDTSANLGQILRSNSSLQVDEKKKSVYWNFMEETLRSIENTSENTLEPVLHKNAQKTLKDSLLVGMVDLLATAAPSKKMRHSRVNYRRVISQSREYIIEHPDQAITILDLCNNLHVSRRTLQNAFQNILGICPIHYLKAIRLNAVRRELISHNSVFNTIQDAATSWGFWHLSQFAADYHHLFKELPSHSLGVRGMADSKLVNL